MAFSFSSEMEITRCGSRTGTAALTNADEPGIRAHQSALLTTPTVQTTPGDPNACSSSCPAERGSIQPSMPALPSRPGCHSVKIEEEHDLKLLLTHGEPDQDQLDQQVQGLHTSVLSNMAVPHGMESHGSGPLQGPEGDGESCARRTSLRQALRLIRLPDMTQPRSLVAPPAKRQRQEDKGDVRDEGIDGQRRTSQVTGTGRGRGRSRGKGRIEARGSRQQSLPVQLASDPGQLVVWDYPIQAASLDVVRVMNEGCIGLVLGRPPVASVARYWQRSVWNMQVQFPLGQVLPCLTLHQARVLQQLLPVIPRPQAGLALEAPPSQQDEGQPDAEDTDWLQRDTWDPLDPTLLLLHHLRWDGPESWQAQVPGEWVCAAATGAGTQALQGALNTRDLPARCTLSATEEQASMEGGRQDGPLPYTVGRYSCPFQAAAAVDLVALALQPPHTPALETTPHGFVRASPASQPGWGSYAGSRPLLPLLPQASPARLALPCPEEEEGGSDGETVCQPQDTRWWAAEHPEEQVYTTGRQASRRPPSQPPQPQAGPVEMASGLSLNFQQSCYALEWQQPRRGEALRHYLAVIRHAPGQLLPSPPSSPDRNSPTPPSSPDSSMEFAMAPDSPPGAAHFRSLLGYGYALKQRTPSAPCQPQAELPCPLYLHSSNSPGFPKLGCGACGVCQDPDLLHLPCPRLPLMTVPERVQRVGPHVQPHDAAATRKHTQPAEAGGQVSSPAISQLLAQQGSVDVLQPSALEPSCCGPAPQYLRAPVAAAPRSAGATAAPANTPAASHMRRTVKAPAPEAQGTSASDPACQTALPSPSPPPSLTGVAWIRQQHLLRQRQPHGLQPCLGSAPTGAAAVAMMDAAIAASCKVAGPGTPCGYAPVVLQQATQWDPDGVAAQMDVDGSLVQQSAGHAQQLFMQAQAAAMSGEPYVSFTETLPPSCEWCRDPNHSQRSCPIYLLLMSNALDPSPALPVPHADGSGQADPPLASPDIATMLAAARTEEGASAVAAALAAASLAFPDVPF
ncbi:hypothetical protein V8C86DRAFT_2964561 [Haematococcus lacustris]